MPRNTDHGLPAELELPSDEFVVLDVPLPCLYLPDRVARLPMRRPLAKLSPEEFDRRLAAGDRRYGFMLYRTHCHRCAACEPIRLEVEKFHPNATQRRTKRRGDERLEVRLDTPVVDEPRIALFNEHKSQRDLSQGDGPLCEYGYREFLTNTCCSTLEMTCWQDGRLVACAIVDAGRNALSAVYTFFDPNFRRLSLGTYCILRALQWCRETNRRFLYLGFYIAASPHMSYKAQFLPHERLIGGSWTCFHRAST